MPSSKKCGFPCRFSERIAVKVKRKISNITGKIYNVMGKFPTLQAKFLT